MSKSQAKAFLDCGQKYPYDDHTPEPVDWAHKIARGVLADLTDRRGVRTPLERIKESGDHVVTTTIVQDIAAIVREGVEKFASDIPSPRSEDFVVEPPAPQRFNGGVSAEGFCFTQIVMTAAPTLEEPERMTNVPFQIDVFNNAEANGKVVVEIAPVDGNTEDITSVSIGARQGEKGIGCAVPCIEIVSELHDQKLTIFPTNDGYQIRRQDDDTRTYFF